MVRVTFGIGFALTILSFLSSPTHAQSRLPQRVVDVMVEVEGVATAAQRQLTTANSEYVTLEKSVSVVHDKAKELEALKKDRQAASALIDGELEKGITELFAVSSQISVIPEITTYTAGIVGLTGAFEEQSSLIEGDETIRCGDSCEYYQQRRNALALIIQGLKVDLTNLREILAVQRQKVQDFAKELAALQTSFNVPFAQFGLRHYLDLKDQLLLNQKFILDDVSRLNLQRDLQGNPARVHAPCSGGAYSYVSLADDLNELWAATEFWGEGISDPKLAAKFTIATWAGGSNDAPGPFRKLKEEYDGSTDPSGFHTPGWLENWQGCIGTKQNIINDLKKKVTSELALGNEEAALQLDLETNTLQVEVDRLGMQRRRLEQINNLLDLLHGMGRAIAPAPKPGQAPLMYWKDAIYAGLRDLQRSMAVGTQVLLAARDLTDLALTSADPLKSLSDHDENAKELLYSVQKRLEALAQQGFVRLEQELTSAADSLGTMSLNIKGLEGFAGEGGLSETISAYHRVVSIRGDQMIYERDVELPERQKEAEALVKKLEQDRGATVALLNDVNGRLELLIEFDAELKFRLGTLKRFFEAKSGHPVYSALLKKFQRELKPDRATDKILAKEIAKFVAKVKTVETKVARKKKSASTSDAVVRKARSLRKRYERSMNALLAQETALLLGGVALSDLLAEARSMGGAVSAL